MKVSQGQYNRLRIEIQINYFRILYGIIRIMAEALGIASGVAGLLSLTMELSKILTDFVNDCRSAPDDVQGLITEVELFESVLKRLDELAQKDPGRYNDNFKPGSALFQSIEHCNGRVESLIQKLKSPGSQAIKRLKWPFNKEESQSTVEMLHRFAQMFSFCLDINNRWAI